MRTKLTLTLEQSVIEKAKIYAKKNGRSLSDVVESYLKAIMRSASKNEPADFTDTIVIKSLRGSFAPPKNFDYKKELQKALTEKYS